MSKKTLFATHIAVGALFWFILAGNDNDSWVIGAPVVLGSAFLALCFPLTIAPRFSVVGWSALAVFFLIRSLRGGWDVARRVLVPSMPIQPTVVAFRLRLPQGPARWFFVHLINLLPGTLSVGLEGDTLAVHVLHQEQPPDAELRQAEARVAAAFRLNAARDESGA